jgi:DNA mismatch repair protein MutS
MLQQYQQLKARFPGTLLMFRLGDFYELFFDDATTAAGELQITLTSRELGRGRRVPMCGVPHHAVEGYLARLVERGYRIAICDQLEDPRRAKGLVKRDVVRVITPGTVIETSLLPQDANSYLVAVAGGDHHWGLAVADLSTGEFQVFELSGEHRDQRLAEELARLRPREVLIPETIRASLEAIGIEGVRYTPLEATRFDSALARRILKEHFRVATLDGFGCETLPFAVAAAGALLQYLKETQFSPLAHITRIVTYAPEEFLVLDEPTRRNLEIIRNLRDGTAAGTLLGILDENRTRMGSRKLRQWLLQPLLDREAIISRQDAIGALVDSPRLRQALRTALAGVGDLERLIGRIGHGSATPREVVAFAQGIRRLPAIVSSVVDAPSEHIRELASQIHPHDELAAMIEAAIVEQPPIGLQEGGIIRDGYNSELDTLRRGAREGKDWIVRLEAEERSRTGIKSLKIGFNKVFGYYIEVSKSNLSLVPVDYIRKQTLTNAERFITEPMKDREAAILGAEERVAELEYSLFCEIRDRLAAHADPLSSSARAIAELDVISALAEVAATFRYVRPEVVAESILEIRAGRHPVVERLLEGERFVPNDLRVKSSDRAVLLVTGPNMAGKSTYLRQAALTALMAQIGSFVPAEAARVGLVDRIFTRIGATDDIATGRSTFLVEMQEVANILHHASERSLVILDEVGRGTSTYDGMSLAWAVVAYLHDHIMARTLFATHYHELTELGTLLPRVHNVNVLVKEKGDRVVFLRKVVDGGADRSYGIHVARLAGIPQSVVDHAQRILLNLEATATARPRQGPPMPARASIGQQLPLPLEVLTSVEEALLTLSLESMTPLEAISALHTLREQVRQRLISPPPAPHPAPPPRIKRHGPKPRTLGP